MKRVRGGDEVPPVVPPVVPPSNASDIRLKEDIQVVGTTVLGLPLYQFRYIDGTQRFEGVMAQDVIEKMPEAVTIGDDGYYRVYYARLGIKMRPV
jgi:hypothetical protein